MHSGILDLEKQIMKMLLSKDDDMLQLLNQSLSTKITHIGNKVHLRGLIEYSNICAKDCYYCGIRKGNKSLSRYTLTDDQVLEAARFAYRNHFGSVVLQSGELESEFFTNKIEKLLKEIKTISKGELGITLSLGEQSRETYQRWFNAGANRYLLRIESSNPELFYKIHPQDKYHDFDRRKSCLTDLKEIGYQTGTGVMIGFPGQEIANLVQDILFFKEFGVDMIGMGPYIDHSQTPMHQYSDTLISKEERLNLSLKMIAVCRILMPEINMAAATALQSLDPDGREKAIASGANIIMPNITPDQARENYHLYENKVYTDVINGSYLSELRDKLSLINHEIAFDEQGNSKYYYSRIQGNS